MTISTAPLSRRSLLLGALAVPALAALVAACGDPDSEPVGSQPGTDGDPAITHPTGADEAIVRISYEGGFVPPGADFAAIPTLLIGGNGMTYSAAVITLQFPGPLVMPVQSQSITERGIQKVLQLASVQGLLATPPQYERNDQIADAPDTVVRIAAGGEVFEHRAYALGLAGEETDPKRKALSDFVSKVTDLASLAGASELGAQTILAPTAYRIQSMPLMEGELTGMDPAPTFVEWPASVGVDLASASTCAKVTAEQAGSLFADATSITFFEQAGVQYRLAVAPALPGDAAC